MTLSEQLQRICSLLERTPEVLFAYLFGSAARGESGPLSDLDLAVYLEPGLDPFAFRLLLTESVARCLGTEAFDLVVLNDTPLLLCYEAIREGHILKESKSLRVEFETRVLNEYLDTAHLRHTQQAYLKRELTEGGHCGQ